LTEFLPFWDADKKTNGILIPINAQCKKCKYNICKNIHENDILKECSYGFNYIKIEERIYLGFLVSSKNLSKQKKDCIYKFPDCFIHINIYENCVLFAKEMLFEIERQIKIEKERIIKDYVKKINIKKISSMMWKRISKKHILFFMTINKLTEQ
jgi:hypothetical protein